MKPRVNAPRIMRAIRERGWNPRQTCIYCGIAPATLAKILDGELPRRLDAWNRLINGLGNLTEEEALIMLHIRRRKDRGGVFILADGRTSVSLKTTKAGLAKELLEKAIREQRGLAISRRIGEFYAAWMKEKEHDPERRKAWLMNVRSVFNKHVLPEFGAVDFAQVNYVRLKAFKTKMLAAGLTLETARCHMNKFRAMWMDARRQGVAQNNPFELLEWPPRRPKRCPIRSRLASATASWLISPITTLSITRW
jgi:hypothetical protein